MNKVLPARIIAAAALAGTAGLVVPAAISGASGLPSAPITVTCTGLIGNATQDVQSGCVGSSSKAKVTPYAVSVPNGGDTGATIYWTGKTTTTLSFTYTSVTSTCSTYLDTAASLEEKETATVTGGTSKLTLETTAPSDVCVYIGSSDGTILVVNKGSYTQ
jgi:hypothetical protein